MDLDTREEAIRLDLEMSVGCSSALGEEREDTLMTKTNVGCLYAQYPHTREEAKKLHVKVIAA